MYNLMHVHMTCSSAKEILKLKRNETHCTSLQKSHRQKQNEVTYEHICLLGVVLFVLEKKVQSGNLLAQVFFRMH